MLNLFTCIVANLYRIHLTLQIADLFFEENQNVSCKKIIVEMFYFIINTVLYIFLRSPLINILVNVSGIAIYTCLYTKSIKKILFVTGVIYALNCCCDTIAVIPFVNYQIGHDFNQFFTIITALLLAICEMIIKKFLVVHKADADFPVIRLVMVPVFSIAEIIYIVVCKEVPNETIVVIGIGLMVINFLIINLYNMLAEDYERRMERNLLDQQLHAYRQQISLYQNSQNIIRSFRHDLRHHFLELKLLAQNNEDVLEYLASMEKDFNQSGTIIDSGNSDIDSLLNYLLERARNVLHHVEAKITIPEHIKDLYDINAIIGNLLENAIDAALKSEEKYLSIQMNYSRNILFIRVENSFKERPKLVNGEFVSEKTYENQNSGLYENLHGFGINNVRKVVNAHNGELNILIEENKFIVNIMMLIDD